MESQSDQLLMVHRLAKKMLRHKPWAQGQEEDLAQEVVLGYLTSTKQRNKRNIGSLLIDAGRKMHLIGRQSRKAGQQTSFTPSLTNTEIQIDFIDLCNIPAPLSATQDRLDDALNLIARVGSQPLRQAVQHVLQGEDMGAAALAAGLTQDQLSRALATVGAKLHRPRGAAGPADPRQMDLFGEAAPCD